MKKCYICKKIKPYSEFNKNKHTIDNYQDGCKKCINKNNLRIKKEFNNLYGVWGSMKKRCYTSTCEAYKYYGGRGIRICEEWKNNFKKFYEWAIKNGHKRGLTLDRRNNDGNYEPSNCRFVTRVENNRNKPNIKLDIEKVKVIKQLLKEGELSQEKIGTIFGVHNVTISKIKLGKLWN